MVIYKHCIKEFQLTAFDITPLFLDRLAKIFRIESSSIFNQMSTQYFTYFYQII